MGNFTKSWLGVNFEFLDVSVAQDTSKTVPGVGLVDATGNQITKFPIIVKGSTGVANVYNSPAIPLVGANFAAAGPYASYVLIGTVAANPNRASIEVHNAVGTQILVMCDDGVATAGNAPANVALFPLAPGAGAGAQGADYYSETFKGRVQIFAPVALSGNQIITYQEN